ncbi:MAG: 3-deoxy-D-manno-octulosonic acid transferase, partial [Paramuribaculum sp.]|nr:3-deoxy-D-manno-octulosonic acid transferase [Paramuribaculum sp.]
AAARYLIIDCFGLLASLYRFASMAYVGGGFGVGIHSVTEAAVFSVPVIFGPNYGKFREAHGLIAAGGAFSVDSPRTFDTIATRMIKDTGRRDDTGKAAGKYIADNVGATETITSIIFQP